MIAAIASVFFLGLGWAWYASIVGTVQSPGYAELVSASDGLAGWLSRDKIIQAVSLADPKAPTLIGTIDTPGFAEAVFQDNQYVYVAGNKELQILPIGDPAGQPVGIFDFSSLNDNFWSSAIIVNEG